MLHSSGSTLSVKIKKILRKKMQYFFENYNMTPLEMYNGLSQAYGYQTRRKNPLVYKGLICISIFCEMQSIQIANVQPFLIVHDNCCLNTNLLHVLWKSILQTLWTQIRLLPSLIRLHSVFFHDKSSLEFILIKCRGHKIKQHFQGKV